MRFMKTAEGNGRWAIPWPCVHEFVSLTTNRKIYRPPLSAAEAFDQIAAWSESPSLTFIAETSEHLSMLAELSVKADIRGRLIHDSRIAAICLQHGVAELWAADRDFSYFPALNTRNPLID
jgi:uncharacterized protein